MSARTVMIASTVTITLIVAGTAGARRAACSNTNARPQHAVTRISHRSCVSECQPSKEVDTPSQAAVGTNTARSPYHFNKNMDASSTALPAPTINSPRRSLNGSMPLRLCWLRRQGPGGGVDPPWPAGGSEPPTVPTVGLGGGAGDPDDIPPGDDISGT